MISKSFVLKIKSKSKITEVEEVGLEKEKIEKAEADPKKKLKPDKKEKPKKKEEEKKILAFVSSSTVFEAKLKQKVKGKEMVKEDTEVDSETRVDPDRLLIKLEREPVKDSRLYKVQGRNKARKRSPKLRSKHLVDLRS